MIDISELLNPYFYFWTFVCVLMSASVAWAYLRCFKIRTRPAVIYIINAIGFTILPVFLRIILPSVASYSIVIAMTFILISSLFTTEGGKLRIIPFYMLNFLIDAITEVFLHIAFINNYTEPVLFNRHRVVVAIIFLFITTPMKYILAAVWNKLINKGGCVRLNWLFIVFPIAQALAFIAMMFRSIGWNEEASLYFILVAMAIFALSDILFLKFISDLEKKNALEKELKELEQTCLILEKHYEGIEAKRYETAKIRHDIKNQITAVRNLVLSGRSDEAGELMGELERSIEQTKEYEYCGIPIINAVLEEKDTVCKEDRIELTVDICSELLSEITKKELCCIFSNLMDNAIKANLKVEKNRYIQLKTVHKGNYTVIACKNPVPHSYRSGKLSPEKSRGYGLKILRDIAAAHDGSFDVEVSDECCTAIFIIKNK